MGLVRLLSLRVSLTVPLPPPPSSSPVRSSPRRRITGVSVPEGVRSPTNEIHAVDPETAAVVHALQGAYAALEPQVAARQAAMVAPIDRLCTGSLPKLKELVTLWAEHAGTYNTAARHWGGGKGVPPPWLRAQMLESRGKARVRGAATVLQVPADA